ncbi:MAG TPA: hypothetical protein VMV81_07010 [Phycisphaerae bacterium]|nr:hypothetical protein [Phycisphaerae bacterium]
MRVRETVAAPSRGAWNIITEGQVLDLRVEKHSPLLNEFAGSESGEYPLTRLRLRTDDGTCTDLVLDQNAVIEVLK